jgi:hypothetical protein
VFGVYGQDVSVNTQIHTEWVNNNQRFLTYNINYSSEYSHAGTIPSILISALAGNEGVVWDMKYSCDRITVNVDNNRLQEQGYTNIIKSTFVHEFGHALGIGDAYNAWYRDEPKFLGIRYPNIETILTGQPIDGKSGYWAPKEYIEQESGKGFLVYVPDNDIMMIRGDTVTSNNIRMVLEAYRQNTPIFFPGSSRRFEMRDKEPVVYYQKYKKAENTWE